MSAAVSGHRHQQVLAVLAQLGQSGRGTCANVYMYVYYTYMQFAYMDMYMLMRDAEEISKQGQPNNNPHVHVRDERWRSKQDQTNNKAKQHSTPKAVTFPKKNELPRVRLVHVQSFLQF